ncbi:MAG: hypothetical protein HQL36_05780 [Alphaproteobacteria bacterium]|nr:hypothetical protein [Alphaproteobacteria bacterium]
MPKTLKPFLIHDCGFPYARPDDILRECRMVGFGAMKIRGWYPIRWRCIKCGKIFTTMFDE